MAFGGVFGIRRKTAATWVTDNTVLFAGELAVETDTRKLKVGDGTTAWNSLGYTAAGATTAWVNITSIPAAIDAIDGLTPAADRLAYYTGASSAALATFTSFGRSLVDDADAAAGRTTLGLVIGTNVQAYAADLATIAGLTATTDNFLQAKASAWASRTPTQVTADLDAFTSALKGLAPASGGGTTNFLRADGTWTAPTASVADGDKGDIAVTASGLTWTIDAGVVTLAKMANMATASLIYRKTVGTGAPEVNTLATLKTDLGLTGTNSGDQTITLTGDVTGSGIGSFAATIGTGVVSLAKMADVATARIFGRVTAGTGVPEALTGTQATTLLDTFTSALKGLVPLSGGGTTNFLRADGTWAAPGGGGGGTTFLDGVFRVQNTADATKQLAFDLAGFTTATTRTWVVPNSSDTFVGLAATQTLSSKTLDNTTTINIKDTLFTLQDDGDATKQVRFQLSGISTGTTRTFIFPDNNGGTLLIDNANQTITNQWTFSATTNNFGTSTGTSFNNLGTGATLTATTKTVQIGIAGVSGSTTTIVIGSAVAGALGTLTIHSPTVAFGSNVTAFNISDSVFTLQDNSDATKQAKFELSGITTATTRTITLPDASGTMMLTSTVVLAAQMPAHTGEVTSSAGTVALTITTNAVTLGKMAQVATARFLGRVTAATGDVEAMTGTQATTLLDNFTSALKGLVPLSGGGTSNYLRADGTWAAPPGSGGSPAGTTGEIQYNNAGAFGGAADVEISGGQLSFPLVGSTPTAPGTTTLKLYGTTKAARPFPTFMRLDGIERPVGQHFGTVWKAQILPISGTATAGALGFAISAVGTATAATLADTNAQTRAMHNEYLVTVAATSAIAGVRGTSTMVTVGGAAAGRGGFFAQYSWGPATGPSTTAGTLRAFSGLTVIVTAPTDLNPSTATNMVGMGADAADTNWQMMHNDSAGTATKIDLGANFPKSTADRTDFYQVSLYSPAGTTQEIHYEVVRISTGDIASGTIATDMPSTTSFLGHRGWCSVGGTSSVVGYAGGQFYIERLNSFA